MGRAAPVDLLYHPGRTEEQSETVLEHPLAQELPKLLQKHRLLKLLRSLDVPEATLWSCVDEGDGWVQRAGWSFPICPARSLRRCGSVGQTRRGGTWLGYG